MLLVVPENEFPPAVIALAAVAHLRALFPSAVLQFHAGPGALCDETNLHLRRHLPTWRPPGKGDDFRSLVRRNPADLEFLAVGRALVESPADTPLQMQLAFLAAEAPRPPSAYLFAEQSERDLRRA